MVRFIAPVHELVHGLVHGQVHWSGPVRVLVRTSNGHLQVAILKLLALSLSLLTVALFDSIAVFDSSLKLISDWAFYRSGAGGRAAPQGRGRGPIAYSQCDIQKKMHRGEMQAGAFCLCNSSIAI
jgi:hypothetical protein